MNETLGRLERVVSALDEGKENAGPEGSYLISQKQGVPSEQSNQSQSLLFQKQVAENLLGSKIF